MLEFLRKHQYGLMLVVAVLTIIAFVFLYDKNTYGQGSARRGTAFKVYGKGYNENHMRELDSYYELGGRLGLSDMLMALRGGKRDDERDLWLDFPMNLHILRKEARDMGITPSNADAEKEIRSMFSDSGSYNAEAFESAKEDLLRRGYHDSDIIQIVKDKVAFDRVRELLLANFQVSSTIVDDQYANRNEKVTAYAISMPLAKHLEAVTVSEEEIKERYEEDKLELMTDEKRKIEYVHFEAPTFPKPPPPPKPPVRVPGAGPKKLPDNFLDGINLDSPTPGAPNGGGTTITPLPEIPGLTTPAPEGTTEGEDGTEEVPAEETPASTEDAPAPIEETTEDEATDATTEEEDPCGAPQDEPVVDDPATEPEATEPEATEPEATEPEATEPEATEPEATEPETTAPVESTTPPAGTATSPAGTDTKPIDSAAPPEVKPAPGTPDPAAKPDPVVKLVPEDEKKKILNRFTTLADRLYNEMGEDADLEALGKKYMEASKDEMFTGAYGASELFTSEEPPAFLKEARDSSGLVREIFAATEGELSEFKMLAIEGREDWLLYRVTEVVVPVQLTLDEAREQLTEKIKREKATEALEEELKAEAEKIKTAMAGEKSFKATADELKIEYERHYQFKGRPTEDPGDFQSYAQQIRETQPGLFSDPTVVIKPGKDDAETEKNLKEAKGYIVYVAEKILDEDDPGIKNDKSEIEKQLVDGFVYQGRVYQAGYVHGIFKAWLDRAYVEAEAERKM